MTNVVDSWQLIVKILNTKNQTLKTVLGQLGSSGWFIALRLGVTAKAYLLVKGYKLVANILNLLVYLLYKFGVGFLGYVLAIEQADGYL